MPVTSKKPRNRGTRRTLPSKKPVAKISPTLSTAVSKIVNRKFETKYVAEDLVIPGSILPSLGTFQQFSSAVTGTGELYACIPRLSVGSSAKDGTRVGNSVTPTSCYVDLMLNVTTDDNSYAVDYMAHVFVLQAKSVRSLDNLSAVPILQLFEDGADGYIGADGTSKMSKYPLNRTEFTVLKHVKRRLVKCWGQTNGVGGSLGTTLATQDSKNSGNVRIRIPIKLPKVLKYDVSSQTYPVNSAPFLCIAWERNDYQGDTAQIQSIYASARTHMRYKDA